MKIRHRGDIDIRKTVLLGVYGIKHSGGRGVGVQ